MSVFIQNAEHRLSKSDIENYIRNAIANIWSDDALPETLQRKIARGEKLSSHEQTIFVTSEAANIMNIRRAIHGIASALKTLEPNFLQIFIGENTFRELSGSGNITKFLVTIDKEEKFFVDFFFFSPRGRSTKHSHNVHCASYQLLGNLREVVYRPVTDNWELVEFKSKPEGYSTIVSPHGDEDDIHAILNDGDNVAVTLHIYGQRVLEKDGTIRINRSDEALGPSPNVKYLSGHQGYTLALRPNDKNWEAHVVDERPFNKPNQKSTIKQENKMSTIDQNQRFLAEALAKGSTSILPQNRERLLPKDPTELKDKLAEIIANSPRTRLEAYDVSRQFAQNGLVVS